MDIDLILIRIMAVCLAVFMLAGAVAVIVVAFR